MTDFELTETGVLTMTGMLMAFALACCGKIAQSRCSNINTPCLSCDREVLDPQTLLELQKMEEGKNKKMPNL